MTAKQARDLIIQMIQNAYEREPDEFLKLSIPILQSMNEQDRILEYVDILRGNA
jgi:hypothetical protein